MYKHYLMQPRCRDGYTNDIINIPQICSYVNPKYGKFIKNIAI